MNRCLPVTLALLFALDTAAAATIAPTRFDDPPPGECTKFDCSLREAVLLANALPGSHVVSLRAGEYLLSLTSDDELNPIMIGNDVEIVGAGIGTKRTTIRATEPGVAFMVGWHSSIAFRRLALTGVDAGSIMGLGGAIRGYQVDLTLDQVDLHGNLDSHAGGIYLVDSLLTLSGSAVRDNHSLHGAGGIYLVNSPATIVRSVIELNTGVAGGGIRAIDSPIRMQAGSTVRRNSATVIGGGIATDGLLVADDNCSITDNVAASGGGISGSRGTVVRGVKTANGSGLLRIADNRAESEYGGVAMGFGGGVISLDGISLERVELVRNRTNYGGGGLYVNGGQTIVRDSRIGGNHASGVGGGAFLADSETLFERVAFDRNRSDGVAGALNLSGDHQVLLRNVDFYANRAQSHAAIFNSSALSLSHVTIWSNTSTSGTTDAIHQWSHGHSHYTNSLVFGHCSGSTGSISAAGNNLRSFQPGTGCPGTGVLSPALVRGTWGGAFEVTGTNSAASPLVNAGHSLYCQDRDIRGAIRDSRCDIGAFEYGASAP